MLESTFAHTLSHLPEKPGVYQYYDSSGKILYIGKAKNLKNRIRSYFALTPTKQQNTPIPSPNCSPRIALMVRQIARIETIVVESESDALILENSFIKQLKPKYNVLLRDDKTYPYIAFDMGLDFPVPIITRQVKGSKTTRYFGPYPNGCREILHSLLELFHLVQRAPSCVAKKRACLFYQINRCKAPCEGKITQEAYAQIVESAQKALESPRKLITLLEAKMLSLSQNLQFEEAATYRDRLTKLSYLRTLCVLDLARDVSFDIVYFSSSLESSEKVDSRANPRAITKVDSKVDSSADSIERTKESDHSQGLLLWLFVRGGKLVSFSHEIVRLSRDYDPSEIYTQALLNRYASKLPLLPESIALPECFSDEQKHALQEAIARIQGRKIPFRSLSRGQYAKFLPIAQENAALLLAQHTDTHASELALLRELQSLLDLEQLPSRIEVFDTSHHSRRDCVGGMIVYDNGALSKENYRRYKLDSSDEYGQMREMLTRRALRFDTEPPPDLWLLDGGKAQITLAKEILESSGIYVDVIAIAKEKRDAKAHRAKGKAKDTIYTSTKHIRLDPSDKRLQFLQKLRDSVHKYAIGYHRHSKKLSLTQNNALKSKGLSQAQIARALALSGSYESLRDKSKQEILELISKA